MRDRIFSKRFLILLAGDILTFGLVTILGFAEHGTLETARGKMLTTFLPLLAGWWLVGPHLGVYDFTKVLRARELWRPFWAMILAAPMAVFLRAVWLNSAILYLFIVILGGVSALMILLWRVIFFLVASRIKSSDGRA